MTQLSEPALVNGMHLYFLSKAAGPLALTTADGVMTPLTAVLDWPANTVSFAGKFNGTEFVTLSGAVNPNATIYPTNASLAVQAMGNSHGSLQWPNPKLVAYYGENGVISTNIDLSVLGANNPFPTQWPLIVDYDQPFGVSYTVPGTALKLTMIFHVHTASLPLSSDPIRPLVVPVISPTVNGNSFFAGQSGVGLNPVLVVDRSAYRYWLSYFRATSL